MRSLFEYEDGKLFMEIIKSGQDMQQKALSLKRSGKKVGLVPTMGYFHEGHLSLMRIARSKADIVVVSNFVNPTQFAPTEDLDAYPRDFEQDCKMAETIPVDIMFSPQKDDIYPDGFRTYVEVEEWGKKLCGMSRPIHFRGVTTVVLKLFNIIQPDTAIFGWKDAQQFLILCRMVKDLNLPVEMIGGEIIREPDGLAMSSRNKYLTPEERREAAILSRSLKEALEMIRNGITETGEIENHIKKTIEGSSHGRLDYVEIVSQETLDPLPHVMKDLTLIALAVHFGKARLIDNLRY
jgi:pantoate--beta-alanine ligase